MPYKNIHFVKVKMELLEDHRFLFQLNDRQKGLYLMLLALAGKTNNQIFNDIVFIKGRLNIKEVDIDDLKKISEVYPKFRLLNDFWGFDNFDETHNQILSKDFGISQGYPKDMQRMDKNRIDKNRSSTKQNSTSHSKHLTTEEFITSLKTNSAYTHINLGAELAKMDAWLTAHPGRKKTKRFVLNWLNKIEPPLEPVKNGPRTLSF